MISNFKPTFSPGKVVATPGPLEAGPEDRTICQRYLRRHYFGDRGDVGDHGKPTNEESFVDGGQIFSSCHLNDGTRNLCVHRVWPQFYIDSVAG